MEADKSEKISHTKTVRREVPYCRQNLKSLRIATIPVTNIKIAGTMIIPVKLNEDEFGGRNREITINTRGTEITVRFPQ